MHRMLNQNEDLEEIYRLGPYSKKKIEVEQSYGHFIIGAPKPWGTHFAYVARDRGSRRFMCHVFRCDTLAKTIANTLRDICRRLMVHRRPSSLAAIEGPERRLLPIEEPKKVIRCHFLGVTQVPKATGIEILNEAVDRLVSQVRPERWILSDVAIAPSTISINEVNGSQIAQCRVRYLSFLGIGRDVSCCLDEWLEETKMPLNTKRPTIVQKIRDSEAGEMQHVKNEDYFHGFIPGNETSQLLKNKGDFLVRQAVKSETKYSQREQFIVSIKLGDNEAKYVPKEQEEGYKKGKEMGGEFKGQLVTEAEYDKMGQKDKDLYVCVEDAICHFPMKYSRRCRVFYMNKYGFTHSSGLIDYHMRHEYSVDRENKEAVLKKAIRKEQWQFNHEQIDRHKHLGDGAFGEVFHGSLRLGLLKTVDVAVKTIKGTVTAEENAELFREAMRMKRFKHPNIVTFYGVASNQDPIMIVMEYCPGDSLLNAVKKKEDPLPMAKKIKYIHDASLGVQYLAQENVVHRDLAARNCLISKEGVAKISDFGLTIVGGRKKEKTLSKVPSRYLAPETLRSGNYNLSTDMWSVGCLVYEVFNDGRELYEGMEVPEVTKFVKTGKRLGIEAGTYPAFLWTLTKRCWNASPDKRITAEQFVEVMEKEDQKHNGGKWFRFFKSQWNDVEMAPAVPYGWNAKEERD